MKWYLVLMSHLLLVILIYHIFHAISLHLSFSRIFHTTCMSRSFSIVIFQDF